MPPPRGFIGLGFAVVPGPRCGLAENRAKVKVMREIIPETLKSEKNLKCSLTNIRQSCKFIYINAVMADFGQQRIRMKSCEKE